MSFKDVQIYNPATEKVVPKGAVVLTADHLSDWDDAEDLRSYATEIEKEHARFAAGALLRKIAEQLDPPKPLPKFELGDKVRYVDTENDNAAWVRRRREKHLGIVVKEWGDDSYKVFDTVENDWWAAGAKHLAPYED